MDIRYNFVGLYWVITLMVFVYLFLRHVLNKVHGIPTLRWQRHLLSISAEPGNNIQLKCPATTLEKQQQPPHQIKVCTTDQTSYFIVSWWVCVDMHMWRLKPALTYISGRWVCGAQRETHCSKTRAAQRTTEWNIWANIHWGTGRSTFQQQKEKNTGCRTWVSSNMETV